MLLLILPSQMSRNVLGPGPLISFSPCPPLENVPAAHTFHPAGTQSKLDALLFTFIPESLIKTSTALTPQSCNIALILAQPPVLPYFSRHDGSECPYLQVAESGARGQNIQRCSQHKIKLERFGSYIWLLRTTCEPCATTEPSIRCVFKLRGRGRRGDMTSKKAKPNNILGKHPPWHSLLSSHLDGRAWCSYVTVPYAALGHLGVLAQDSK